MDGLLIDSEPIWRKIESKIYNKLGAPVTEKMCAQTMGIRLDEAVEYWFEKYPWGNAPTLKEVENEIVAKVIEYAQHHGEPKEGAFKVINLVKNLGCKIAIASSSPIKLIDAVIKRLNLESVVDVKHSAFDEKRGKPAPDVYLTTAKKLGIDPEECVAFEDSVNGVLSAKAAGMKCIAVPDPLQEGDKGFEEADVVEGSLEDVTGEMMSNLID